MTLQLRVSVVSLLIAVVTGLSAGGCKSGNSPSIGNFTILAIDRVTFTGLYGGTYEAPFSVALTGEARQPIGPGQIGGAMAFSGESGRDGIYKVIDGVVPAVWFIDQVSGPCRERPGRETVGQVTYGATLQSLCEHTSNVVGLININGDGIIFDGGCCNTDTLTAGMSLSEGQTITSQNGQYVLVYQGDGNLVAYNWSNGVPIWNSVTHYTNAGTVAMQSDGNFVVYEANGTPLFHTGTYGNPGAYARLENTGNLVIYSAGGSVLWSSLGGGGGTGRWKSDGNGGCYWDQYDSGPDQCAP